VEITLAGRAIARERRDDPSLVPQLRCEPKTVRDREHRGQVTDHADDAVLEHAEVERAVTTRRDAAFAEQQLVEQAPEIEPACREHAEIPMHRQDEVVPLERCGHADGDGLLPDPGEPLPQLALPQQPQHLLLDQPRQQQRSIQRDRIGRRIHCRICGTRLGGFGGAGGRSWNGARHASIVTLRIVVFRVLCSCAAPARQGNHSTTTRRPPEAPCLPRKPTTTTPT
jgi:hypothetical protein